MLEWVAMVYWAQWAQNRKAATDAQPATVDGEGVAVNQPEPNEFSPACVRSRALPAIWPNL